MIITVLVTRCITPQFSFTVKLSDTFLLWTQTEIAQLDSLLPVFTCTKLGEQGPRDEWHGMNKSDYLDSSQHETNKKESQDLDQNSVVLPASGFLQMLRNPKIDRLYCPKEESGSLRCREEL